MSPKACRSDRCTAARAPMVRPGLGGRVARASRRLSKPSADQGAVARVAVAVAVAGRAGGADRCRLPIRRGRKAVPSPADSSGSSHYVPLYSVNFQPAWAGVCCGKEQGLAHSPENATTGRHL